MVASGSARSRKNSATPGGDIDAAPDVADDRIAGVGRVRDWRRGRSPARASAASPISGLAEIAGQQPGAARERADRLESGHAIVDHAGVEGAAAPAGIAGMARELHGHQRPDLAPEPLQRKDRRRIADMAVDDMRLDGEDRREHGRSITRAIRGG